MAVAYYARLEAYYRDVGDLLSLSVRRFCNLVLHWMMEHTDPEVWKKEYSETFFGDPKTSQPTGLTQSKLQPAQKGQAGSLNIKPKPAEEKVQVTDLSQFFGRAGNAGKTDPNKKAIAAKAKATRIKIAPDESGNLGVEGAPPPSDG